MVDIKITICEYTIHRRQGAIDKQDVSSLIDSAVKAQNQRQYVLGLVNAQADALRR